MTLAALPRSHALKMSEKGSAQVTVFPREWEGCDFTLDADKDAV